MNNIIQSSWLAALVAFGISITGLNAQIITVPQTAEYTNDAHTLLLEHFDGSTGGSPNGTATYTNAVFGQGIHLNAGSWVAWNLGALSQGTVELWAKLDTVTNETFIGSGYSQFYAITFDMGLPTNTPFCSYHNGSVFISSPYLRAPVITTNTWHHYAATWGSQGLHLYVDGTLVGTNSNTSGQNAATGWWCIGGQSASGPGWGADNFNGTIDELRISNIQRVFAPAPPQVLFVKAFTVDYSNLLIGTNYQPQASTDLVNWTNWGASFTATNSTYTGTNYQRIANWNSLFFRMVQQ